MRAAAERGALTEGRGKNERPLRAPRRRRQPLPRLRERVARARRALEHVALGVSGDGRAPHLHVLVCTGRTRLASARGFYERMGFAESGTICGDDLLAMRRRR